MAQNNIKYVQRENAEWGRYLVAKKTIKQGETILTETPLYIGPNWDATMMCLNCYCEWKKYCKKCKIVPLCLKCDTHDDIECKFFQNESIDKNFLIDNFATILPIRCLLSAVNIDNNGTTDKFSRLLQMESHLETRRTLPVWTFIDTNIVQPILQSKMFEDFAYPVTPDVLQKICGILDVNSFEVRGPNELTGYTGMDSNLRGLYPNAALPAHNCVSNVLITVDAQYNLKMHASVDILENSPIFTNYTNLLMNTADRREFLQDGKYFICKCERCSDPTELGTHLSSIKCTSCDTGNLMPPEWQCDTCNFKSNNEIVDAILSSARSVIENTEFDIRHLESTNIKLSRILNPSHAYVIGIKQNIASILRDICVHGTTQPARTVIRRKLEICEEILPLLQKLHPGISRLTGIALYETYVPLVQLAQRDYDLKEINTEELLDKLQYGEQLLKQSLGMLLYEHASVPEGQLAKRGLGELKELRVAIDGVKNKSHAEKNNNKKKKKNN